MTDGFKYELGSQARCKITKYEGLIIARTEWLYGCRRYVLQTAKTQESGKPLDSLAVDEAGLELVVAAPPHEVQRTGGDAPAPTRQAEPARY